MMHPEDLSRQHSSNVNAAITPETPFVIVLHRRDLQPSGYFRPEAAVTLRPAFRTSGLLRALSPEDIKYLLLMLTFVTPNGWCRPSLYQMADALRVPEGKAQASLQRLQSFRWQGRPVVTRTGPEDGTGRFYVSPAVAALQDAPEPATTAAPSLPPSRRSEIVAYTRANYARPRAEVERMIAEQMGWKEEGTGPEALLRRRLLGVPGLQREQVDKLVEQHPAGCIERQLDWLPHRNAKSPARFLLAAIENDYDPPIGVRLDQTRATQAQATSREAEAEAGAEPQGSEEVETERREIEKMDAGELDYDLDTELQLPDGGWERAESAGHLEEPQSDMPEPKEPEPEDGESGASA